MRDHVFVPVVHNVRLQPKLLSGRALGAQRPTPRKERCRRRCQRKPGRRACTAAYQTPIARARMIVEVRRLRAQDKILRTETEGARGHSPNSHYGSLCEDLRVLCVKFPRLNAEDAEVSAEAPRLRYNRFSIPL